MKGKRYTTEDKIRILRDADRGKSSLEVCRAHNIPEVSFHRWKRQFGQMDLNEARKLKELERENSELKKTLAESLLKNRVLEAVAKKMVSPAHRRMAAHAAVKRGLCSGRAVCRFLRLARATFHYRGQPICSRQRRLKTTSPNPSRTEPTRHQKMKRCGWQCRRKTPVSSGTVSW